MRDRDAGGFRRSDRGRDTGNHFDGDARPREHEHLFCAPAEHERVAALQPDNLLAAARGANHQTIDRVLFDTRPPGSLTDAETLRSRETAQRLGIDQGIVQNEIGLFDSP
jgi:hypothetical protein